MTDEIRFEEAGEIKEFVQPRPTLYVAVYYYPNSEQPWGMCGSDKQNLITSAHSWGGLDKTKPVRIYTITP